MSKTFRLPPTIFNYGIVGGPDRQYVGENVDLANFVGSRPRPIPLNDTVMTIQKDRVDPDGFFLNPPGLRGQVPANQYWLRSSPVVKLPGNAEKQAALLAAQARFTGSAMNLGETLGSIKETGNMLSKRGLQMFSLFNNARKGRWRAVEDQLKGKVSNSLKSQPTATKRVAGLYLEGMFGWSPLVSDMYNSLELLHDSSSLGVASRSSASKIVTGAKDPLSGTSAVTSAKVSVRGTVSNPGLRTLNQLGLANPALTAWELFPFSFLVDWVLGTSQVFAYFTSGFGLSNMTGSYTRDIELVERYYGLTQTGPDKVRFSSRRIVQRTPLTSLDVEWEALTWLNSNYSVTQAILSLALFEQLRPRRS